MNNDLRSPVVESDGNGGVVDFSQAAVSVGGVVSLGVGATWNGPAGKCGSFSFQTVNCGLEAVSVRAGVDKTFAVS